MSTSIQAGSDGRADAPVPPTGIPPTLSEAILAWYDARGRTLAFRASRDPYAILVSEVMAQQTQIGRVVVAWRAWLERFPTVEVLASASPADVLRQWAGLGYNRRAIQLHRAARVIVAEHGGTVPSTVSALETLPGIGPYTARAVAAIAFGRPVGAIDTNVRRVLGRIVAGSGPATSGRALQAIADDAVPIGRSAAWTHALMDVGAELCRPRNPRCDACPARERCRFAAEPAAGPRPPRAGRVGREAASRPPRFALTTRWLRGRIVERLAATDGWARVAGPVGDHPPEAVAAALTALARDGLVELHPDDVALARLAES